MRPNQTDTNKFDTDFNCKFQFQHFLATSRLALAIQQQMDPKQQMLLLPRSNRRHYFLKKRTKFHYQHQVYTNTNNKCKNLINLIVLIFFIYTLILISVNFRPFAQAYSPLEPLASIVTSSGQRPAHFAEPESDNNVQRVAVGRSVRFKCVVNDIGDHKLAWFHKDRRLLLAFDNKTVAWRDRIQVSSQANSVFFLQIDSVQLSDKVSCYPVQ